MTKSKTEECPRAHFHRPGSYCKTCKTFIPARQGAKDDTTDKRSSWGKKRS